MLPSDTSTPANPVENALANARLDALRESSPGILAEEEKKKKREAIIQKLGIAIVNALFLEPERKKMWLDAVDILSFEEADSLLNAILRENIRWKKNLRKITFPPIPEQASEARAK